MAVLIHTCKMWCTSGTYLIIEFEEFKPVKWNRKLRDVEDLNIKALHDVADFNDDYIRVMCTIDDDEDDSLPDGFKPPYIIGIEDISFRESEKPKLLKSVTCIRLPVDFEYKTADVDISWCDGDTYSDYVYKEYKYALQSTCRRYVIEIDAGCVQSFDNGDLDEVYDYKFEITGMGPCLGKASAGKLELDVYAPQDQLLRRNLEKAAEKIGTDPAPEVVRMVNDLMQALEIEKQ